MGIDSSPFAEKQRYDNHMNRSRTAGDGASTRMASRSVGIGWAVISWKNSSLEYNDVFKFVRKDWLLGIAAVPDLRFAEKIESRPVNYLGLPLKAVRPEEDRRAEDALKRGDQSPVLLAALMHPE